MLRRSGESIREIARRLDRAPSTVSRELRRNTAAYEGEYDAALAQARARERGRRNRTAVMNRDHELRAVVKSKLEWPDHDPAPVAGHGVPHRRL